MCIPCPYTQIYILYWIATWHHRLEMGNDFFNSSGWPQSRFAVAAQPRQCPCHRRGFAPGLELGERMAAKSRAVSVGPFFPRFAKLFCAFCWMAMEDWSHRLFLRQAREVVLGGNAPANSPSMACRKIAQVHADPRAIEMFFSFVCSYASYSHTCHIQMHSKLAPRLV